MENYKNKDWLFNEYFILKRNCGEIGRSEKRDAKTIWSWIKKFNIPTRSRGAESSPGTFAKGHKKGVGRVLSEKSKEKIRSKCIERGSVPYLKNGVHWLKQDGVKPASWRGGITPDRQSVYSSQEWVNAVKKVWERDNATCQRCGKHHNTEINRGSFHIHHKIPFSVKEKRTDYNNLILLCNNCHRWVHSKENINNQFIEKWKQ